MRPPQKTGEWVDAQVGVAVADLRFNEAPAKNGGMEHPLGAARSIAYRRALREVGASRGRTGRRRPRATGMQSATH